MTLKHFLQLCIMAFMPITAFANYEIKTLADEFDAYKKYASTTQTETVLPLLNGETLRFSDFGNNSELQIFRYEVPDTIWLKERPKKNPREGKHYELRTMYRGQKKTGNYFTDEYTPAVEIIGALFKVLNIEKAPSQSNYSSRNSYKIHMLNEATGERLYWEIPETTLGQNFKVHLSNLSNNLGLKGRTIYSAYRDSYSYSTSEKFKNVTKHQVNDVDAYLDFRSIAPNLKIVFTTVDERNNSAVNELRLSQYPSSYCTQWYDECQISAIQDADKVYVIDYFVRLNARGEDFPFNFRIICGMSSEYYTPVYQTLKPGSYQSSDDHLSNEDLIFIADRINVRGKDYYKGVLDGKPFFIETSKIKLLQEDKLKLDSLVNSPQEIRDAFFEFTKALSYLVHCSQLEKVLNTINGFASKGVSIPSWGVYDMSEYTDGTGMRFSFHNPTKKTIKYVNVSFVGYNAVDDRVGRAISKRCIGPIEPDETASYDFEYAWFTDVVEYAKMTSLSVQYMDGTTKTVAKPSSVVWSDEINEGLKSKLESLKSQIVD